MVQSGIVRKQSINAHDWYGAIADLNYKKTTGLSTEESTLRLIKEPL